jgi:hypothetical protein
VSDSPRPPSAEAVSDALVVWTGWGRTSWPKRDERRLAEVFGEAMAVELLPLVRRLEEEFYESDTRFTAPDLRSMRNDAKARFRDLHPELSEGAIKALAWCYTFDHR